MNFGFALIASALSGWIALSYEIVWARIYGFTSGAHADSFGKLLAAYLLGLAIGALATRRAREAIDPGGVKNLLRVARVTLIGNLLGFLVAPAVAQAGVHIWWGLTYAFVIPAAAMLGFAFPLLCHAAIPPDDRAGAHTSYLYVSNIIGSVMGSLTTGFVLMDHLTLVQIARLLALLGVGLAALLGLAASRRRGLMEALVSSGLGAAFVLLLGPTLYDQLWEKLQFGRDFPRNNAAFVAAHGTPYHFADVHESKSGVITVGTDFSFDEATNVVSLKPGQTIWGGGIYDGRLDTMLEPGGWLVRPYAISYVHPAPKRVLMIGLSGAAWANILIGNPYVEHIKAIEISEGYLDVIRRHPEVSPILDNKNFEVVIDDGRRWLVRNPDEKFDLIVANTTFHWRSFASNLLSKEFQTLVSDHLAPGGVYIYNTTGSRDAAVTSADVFPHTLMIINNVVASKEPFDLDIGRWRKALENTLVHGKKPFPQTDPDGKDTIDWITTSATFVNVPEPRFGETIFRDREGMLAWAKGGRVVTDDNMICEW
jgi:spermidine synthase